MPAQHLLHQRFCINILIVFVAIIQRRVAVIAIDARGSLPERGEQQDFVGLRPMCPVQPGGMPLAMMIDRDASVHCERRGFRLCRARSRRRARGNRRAAAQHGQPQKNQPPHHSGIEFFDDRLQWLIAGIVLEAILPDLFGFLFVAAHPQHFAQMRSDLGIGIAGECAPQHLHALVQLAAAIVAPAHAVHDGGIIGRELQGFFHQLHRFRNALVAFQQAVAQRAATIYLILDRLDYLKSEAQLESVVSRESSFLFNNLVLLASCFAVLWGTLFPIISEAVSGEKISLDKGWFNQLMIPIGLFLLILTGVGPLFAWRRTSTESLRRNFAWPGIASLVLVGALIAAGMRDFYALISFGFCLFVAVTIIIEFFKGAKQIAAKNQFNFAHAVVELTHRNTRRYGGYVVHMGIVLMFVGFTGAAFNQNRIDEMKPGDSVRLGTYQLTVKATNEGENENYLWQKASVAVNKNGKFLGVLEPESRVYKASRQPTHEVAVRPRLNEDLYLNFAGMNGRPGGDSVLHLPSGFLDLDRRAYADLRHAGGARAQQGEARVRAYAGGGHNEEACNGGKLVSCCSPSRASAWRRPSRRS